MQGMLWGVTAVGERKEAGLCRGASLAVAQSQQKPLLCLHGQDRRAGPLYFRSVRQTLGCGHWGKGCDLGRGTDS